ncbi:actin cytoskeleton-regulatory complex protein PAN1-like [Xyrichtys novacula]|uniref:Actin cytoskeleton-regulatory complex protein PAN1-like n=1 Tax=Xyrichtys novacula TaxID=13765 RepID=A0AAV1EWK2_XYRNO|nr:actin cytoskeleton-regulatory complex protein PAN1-like [Xyrichtys novacula]
MMYSCRSEHSHRGQYSERSSRQWEGYDNRREERRDPHRDVPQDSHHKYGRDGPRAAERTSRGRKCSDSPKRPYNTDSLNREWSRKSPVRRRTSSSDWGSSERKSRRFTEDNEDDYRYKRETEDKSYRLSSDNFSRSHPNKDLKHSNPQDEDFKYRKTTQDSRHKYRHEESTYRHHQDDLNCRPSSGYYKDRDSHERSWDHSGERRQSQDYTSKSYAKLRERNDSPSAGYEDHCSKRARFSMNGSSGQSFESEVPHQIPVTPEEKKTQGFQRFLDVLNKGVNVDTLTKIVTSERRDDRQQSPLSSTHPADRPWSPDRDGVYQTHDNSNWSESVRAHRVSPPHHRSFSPKRSSLSDDRSLQKGAIEHGHFSSSSRSRSPSVVEKITLTPEEEHKHRQMQDVLQAIGMNLGFEELGQMSHRIQERLYGKKDSDREGRGRRSREMERRRAYSPKLQSRSSSSRSSFSPPPREYYMKKDSDSPQRDFSEDRQIPKLESVKYDTNASSDTLFERKKYETTTQEKTAGSQAVSPNHTYTSSKPSPPPPAVSAYSPASNSLPPFPVLPPGPPPSLPPALPQALPRALPHPLPPPFPPGLPPYFPNVRPRFLFPHRPPILPITHAPPLNLFPGLLPQTRHLFPQNISNTQPPFLNLPPMNPMQLTNNTQNKKTLSRPRCLQVIKTKQAG